MKKTKKRALIALAVCLIMAASLSALGVRLHLDNKRLASLNRTEEDFLLRAASYQSLRDRIQAREGKGRSAKPTGGIVEAVDRIFTPLGLKDKVKSVKAAASTGTTKEEQADVTVQGVSMNEAVNFLYDIDTSSALLVVRRITLRPSFEHQDLLNVTMTLSLLKPE